MPSTFSPSLRLELIGAGEQAGIWNQTTNNNLGELLEQAIAGRTTLDVTLGNFTLSSLNGVVDEARSAVLAVTGTPGVTRVLTIPNEKKTYTVINQTTNTIQVKTTTGTAFNCAPSATSVISCDGNNGVQGSSIAPLTSPTFTGVPVAPTAAPGTNTTQIATTAFTAAAVSAAISAALPAGVITMWSGSIASIPAGWALCNGASGTPDLRDRFVVGAGTSYAPGNTGGANTVTLDVTQIPSHTHAGSGTTSSANVDHTHSGSTGTESNGHFHTGGGNTGFASNDHSHSGTTSTESVGHTHGVTGTTGIQNANHGHSGATDSQGLHNHDFYSGTFGGAYTAFPNDEGGPGNIGYTYVTSIAGAHNHNVSTGIQNADHGHSFSVTSGGISNNHTHVYATGGQSANHQHAYSFSTSDVSANHNHGFTSGGMNSNTVHAHSYSFTTSATGGSAAHENRPPYFALAYIMKT